METGYENFIEDQLCKIRDTFCNIVSIDKQQGYTRVDIVTSWKLKELRKIIKDNDIKYECLIYNKDITIIEI